MKKIIKEIKKNNFIYQLGYNLYYNKIYPRIEIFKDEELFFVGRWDYVAKAGLFYFCAFNSSLRNECGIGYVDTIKELFIELKKYNEIPQNIENEFENMFIMYKLNDFNKI